MKASPETALAEYKALKTEQTARISTRDNLIYATGVAIAGTLTIAHTAGGSGYLLLVPAVTVVLGWTYLANDNLITAIGRYFRQHPGLSALGWESEHPADARRFQRKAIQLAVDLTVFCGSGLVALLAFWTSPAPSPLLLAASAIEAIGVAVLAWQFTTYSPCTIPRIPGRY